MQEELDQVTCHISARMKQGSLLRPVDLASKGSLFGTAGLAPPLVHVTEVGCAVEMHMNS